MLVSCPTKLLKYLFVITVQNEFYKSNNFSLFKMLQKSAILPRDGMVVRLCCCRLSVHLSLRLTVCLSVTSQCSIKTAKHRITQ